MSDPDMGARPRKPRMWLDMVVFGIGFWITVMVIYWALN